MERGRDRHRQIERGETEQSLCGGPESGCRNGRNVPLSPQGVQALFSHRVSTVGPPYPQVPHPGNSANLGLKIFGKKSSKQSKESAVTATTVYIAFTLYQVL